MCTREGGMVLFTNPRAVISPYPSELELVQPHMAQKPVLRGDVGCACVALFQVARVKPSIMAPIGALSILLMGVQSTKILGAVR